MPIVATVCYIVYVVMDYNLVLPMIFVSSASIFVCTMTTSDTSFMKIAKSNGSKTEPCGTSLENWFLVIHILYDG